MEHYVCTKCNTVKKVQCNVSASCPELRKRELTCGEGTQRSKTGIASVTKAAETEESARQHEQNEQAQGCVKGVHLASTPSHNTHSHLTIAPLLSALREEIGRLPISGTKNDFSRQLEGRKLQGDQPFGCSFLNKLRFLLSLNRA